MAYTQLALGLTLTIPTNGTRNWGATLLQTTWTKISSHAHTGGGDGNQIPTAGIADHAISKDKISKNAGLFQYASTLAPAGTTQTLDWANGSTQKLDLGSASGDVTLTLSNPVIGVTYKIINIQGATPRDLIWPASVKWPQGQKPILSQTNDAIDKISLYWDGTNYLGDWNITYA